MKSLIRHLILLCILASLAVGCMSSSPKVDLHSSPNECKKVLCTINMISDLVRSIAKDKVEVQTLIKKDLDPHSYELVKGDDERLLKADLIFYSGLGLEHSPNIYRHLTEHSNSYAIGSYIQKRYPHLILQTNGQIDPHIWMDVSVWGKGVQLIVDELCKVAPKDADFFRQNGVYLQEEMEKVHFQVLALIQEIPNHKRYLITCHDAFYYFAKGYLSLAGEHQTEAWRNRFIAPEGLAPDCQLSTADIQKVILFLKEHQISTIFPEYNVNLDSIYKIKEASTKSGLNVEIAQNALYGDTMSQEHSSEKNYLDMIIYNAQTIHQYLTQEDEAK